MPTREKIQRRVPFPFRDAPKKGYFQQGKRYKDRKKGFSFEGYFPFLSRDAPKKGYFQQWKRYKDRKKGFSFEGYFPFLFWVRAHGVKLGLFFLNR